MTNTLQNRLVGTIIVVALVVIFVPEFLDGEKRVNQQAFVGVPPVTDVVTVQKTEPFDTSEVESQLNQAVEIVNELPVDDVDPSNNKNREQASKTTKTIDDKFSIAKVTNEEKAKKPKAAQPKAAQKAPQKDELNDIDIKDSGWVVQLGSFKHEKNVKELLKTLKSAGYRAYSRPVMTSVGELTKVFVGPELDKEKLELALPHLKKITNLKGKITAFEVSAG
jgi:DedD protein